MSKDIARILVRQAQRDQFNGVPRLIVSDILKETGLTEEELLKTLRDHLAELMPDYVLIQASPNLIRFEHV